MDAFRCNSIFKTALGSARSRASTFPLREGELREMVDEFLQRPFPPIDDDELVDK